MKFLSKTLISAGILSLMSGAFAQGKFPEGTIKMIVPFAAGGGVDSAARLIAKQMQTDLNVTFVVENLSLIHI